MKLKRKDRENNKIKVTETTHYVHIKDIVIPKDFAKTKVGHNKVRWAKEYYQRNGFLDKPISVIPELNERGYPNRLLLVDQYSRYMALMELGIEEAQVKYIDIDTYCSERYI